MEFRVLKYFLTVAREENMTRAAEILYVTQPTLSRQIAELEEEIGTPLFVRSNRSVTLTDAGMLLRRRVEELLALEDKIKSELGNKENLSGTVSIGMAEASSANVVADIIGVFRKKYPHVKFELFTAMADQVLERIDKDSMFIGLPKAEKSFLHLSNGKTLMIISRVKNDTINTVTFNGKKVLGYKIQVKELLEGGELIFN